MLWWKAAAMTWWDSVGHNHNPYDCNEATLWWPVLADNVGNTAAFPALPLASAITGTVIYVDKGLHAMGLAVDSPCVGKAASAPSEMSNVPAWSGPFLKRYVLSPFNSKIRSFFLTLFEFEVGVKRVIIIFTSSLNTGYRPLECPIFVKQQTGNTSVAFGKIHWKSEYFIAIS